MHRSAIAPLFVVVFLHTNSHAEPTLTWDEGRQLVVGAQSICAFVDDEKTLKITDGSKAITNYTFCSSYGKASARIVIDRKNTAYLLLEYGEGRGTNAVNNYLAVFRVASNMVEVARTPISWPSGPTTRWTYDFAIATPVDGGIALTLSLKPTSAASSESVPPEPKRTINVSAKSDA